MRIECTISFGLVNCKRTFVVYIEDEQLEDITGQAREIAIFDEVRDQAFEQGLIEFDWKETR